MLLFPGLIGVSDKVTAPAPLVLGVGPNRASL